VSHTTTVDGQYYQYRCYVVWEEGRDLALSKTFEIDTESRFFSANEEFEDKHLSPFVIYALMPLQDSVCPAICTVSVR
jgi:hypothetical protein